MSGIYSPDLWATLTPANVKGGINRARSAKRDQWGRLLPKDGTLPAPSRHGVAGGKARASKAKRNEKGEFSK